MSAARRRIVPEVVQTSGMDCGPAALACLLQGFGVPASYGRLREACQTDVDGTSIDALEDAGRLLGLDAVQVMLPADHVLLPAAEALPAIVVLRLPNGLAHFVVAWRRHGRWVQVMDPAVGRRWVSARRLEHELFVHTMPVPAAAWREWAGSEAFLGALRVRLAALGAPEAERERLIEEALADPGWRGLGTLDAATRSTAAVIRSGGLRPGTATATVVARLSAQARAGAAVLPDAAWSVRPDPDDAERVLLSGAVLVSVTGRAPGGLDEAALPAELRAALHEPPERPGRRLLAALCGEGRARPAAVAAGAALAAGGVLVEALLFRGLIDGTVGEGQPGAAVWALVAVVAALLVLDGALASSGWRLGRGLEGSLRLALLMRLPLLADRYFRSRPVSDMAERAHMVHQLRLLPDLATRLIAAVVQLVLVAVGIAWLDPASAPAAGLAAVVLLALALAVQVPLRERDLRLRNHAGALGRFSLDALLGLVPLRAHAAEDAVRREHDSLLEEWARTGRAVVRAAVAGEALQTLAGFAFAVWIVADGLPRADEPGSALLLVFWALSLPLLGQEIGLLVRQYPLHRNVTLRFLEPLRAATDEPAGAHEAPHAKRSADGVAVALRDVTVHAAGHTVLAGVDLDIAPGTHVAIVGPSGAGKSSLVGLLLGWHVPAAGSVAVDGAPLDGPALARLRSETAWVDPAVQLWNRSLRDNLLYGTEHGDAQLDAAIDGAELDTVLDRLPDGLDTVLGEGGGLLSGGEGQRVRAGRGLLRPGVRLALLDEPFRGLDRAQRARLLARARAAWADATLLCVTHDVGETTGFERVIVVEDGRIVEDGAPGELAASPSSRYRAMLDAEREVRAELWEAAGWRRLRLEQGRLREPALDRSTP